MSIVSARHAEATRHAIVEAASELLLERRNDGFSVQEVADRARLTHRTVYRHFPTRQELMAATADSLGAVSDDAFREVATVEEWLDAVPSHLARTEASLGIVRSILAAVLASDELVGTGQGMRDRDARRWTIFRGQFPNLPEGEARRMFVMLRHVTSSASYVLLRLRFAMSADEAVETISSGARQLVEQVRRRNEAAAHESPADG